MRLKIRCDEKFWKFLRTKQGLSAADLSRRCLDGAMMHGRRPADGTDRSSKKVASRSDDRHIRKNFQDSRSHRIFGRMHGVLNIDENKN